MAKRAGPKLFKLLNEDLIEGTENWDTLTVARCPKAQLRKILSLSLNAPLAAAWKPLQLNLLRQGRAGDFFFFREGIWVVSQKAVRALKPVVGESVEFLPATIVAALDPDTNKVKKLSPRETQQVFFVRPLKLVELADGAKSELIDVWDGDLEDDGEPLLEVWKYAFHPEDLEGLHFCRVSANDVLLASKTARDAISKAKLTGVEFVELDYKAADEAKSAASRSVLKSPKPFDFEKVGDKPKISKALWKSWVDHWSWLCANAAARGGEAIDEPEIAKPVSARKLASIQEKIGAELPREFADVLSKFSGRVSFFWNDESELHGNLPESLCDVYGGGQNPIWDIDNLVEFANAAKDRVNSPWLAFREGLRDRLPFMEVGNGDLIAFDMREGSRNCPIVYLSHENDETFHDRRLGTNFIDFMTRWTNLGCPGPDFGELLPFYAIRSKRLNVEGRVVKRWKRWLAEGK